MPDWTEFQEGVAEEKKSLQDRWAVHARGSHMVALKLEELLESDSWNTYVAHLKALQEEDEAEITRWRTALETPGQTADQIGMILQQLQRVIGRLERGRQALDLPKEVIARDYYLQQTHEKTLDKPIAPLVSDGT